MNITREYSFRKWKWERWEEAISFGLKQFIDDYKVVPHLLYVNKYTFLKINFMINNVPGAKDQTYSRKNGHDTKVDPQKNVKIGIIHTKNGDLIIQYNSKLKAKRFELVYEITDSEIVTSEDINIPLIVN